MGMFPAALRRNVGDGAFQKFEQSRCHALAGESRVMDGFSSLRPILSISSI